VHQFRSPIADVISAGVVDFDDNKHMLKMGADVLRREGERSGLLEHDGDYVVANVPLPQQLGKFRKNREGGIKVIALI